MLRTPTALVLLLSCSLSAQVSYFSVSLAGENQVPPVATSGGGYGIVRLQQPANTVRIFAHYFSLTAAPTAAHLHLAPAGANGGVIVPLAAGAGVNTFTANATLTAAQVAALQAGGTYINIHTPLNPGGEIRGQAVPAESTRFVAALDGSQQVPPVATAASGVANAYLHQPDNRLVYMVESTGLVNVTAAHLHGGAVGTNGGVMFPLAGSAGIYCGVSRRLSAAEVAAIFADATYFNVHTAANPGGEIRGQLLKDPGSDFHATMNGAQEVPPVATAASGDAAFHIDIDGTAHVSVAFGGLSGPPTAAHLHQAPTGTNGGVVVPLTLSGGRFVATFTPTAAQLAQLRADNWYVNIHTAAHPGGEIRGQLGTVALPSTFGPNCPLSSGSRPEIGATGFGALGAPVEIELYGGLAGGAAFLSLGFGRDGALGQALPLPLQFLGINAPCFLLQDASAALLSIANGNGCATRSISFGFVPPAIGLHLYGQWFALDAGAPGGLAASNALDIELH
ncbi:MAG: CHRD domain-containing protein [Planctomycetes bacterium]|nr:CHRD domain-containing protein [Planctomycetota bacterium]